MCVYPLLNSPRTDTQETLLMTYLHVVSCLFLWFSAVLGIKIFNIPVIIPSHPEILFYWRHLYSRNLLLSIGKGGGLLSHKKSPEDKMQVPKFLNCAAKHPQNMMFSKM